MEPSLFPYKVVQGTGGEGRVCVASRRLSPGEIVLVELAVACVAAPTRSLCDDCLAHLDADERVGKDMHQQCADCLSLSGPRSNSGPADASSNSAMDTDMREPPSLAVRLSAKLLFRRLSGRLGHEQASKIDSLMHQADQRHFSGASHQNCGTSDGGSNGGSSSGPDRTWSEEDEDECIQVAKRAAGIAHGAATGGASGRLLLMMVSDGLGKEAPILDLARKELRRVCMNAITTCDGSGATGLALCPSGAMFNHSCTPNCQVWWRGSQLEVRCTKSVVKGEELCFSYIHIDQLFALRQAQLRRSWFFTCRCRRCVSQEWDTELMGLRCLVAMCGGAVPPSGSGVSKSQRGGGSGRGRREEAFCKQCGSSNLGGARFARSAGSAPDDPVNRVHETRTTAMASPSCRAGPRRCRTREPGEGEECEDVGVLERSATPAGTTGRSCAEQGPIIVDKKGRDGGVEEEGRLLAEADRFFEEGMDAYMREDPEVAIVALEKSLLVREKILHPFNKVLLRTLRYGSMAAIATSSWDKAHSFLSRWLYPMDTMFGAAEVWDIAAMRIENGLVLEQLSTTTTDVPGTVSGTATLPRTPLVVETSPQERKAPSVQSEAAAGGGLHPAAYRELAEGLRSLWTCLGKDTGLPAEIAALQVCAENGIKL